MPNIAEGFAKQESMIEFKRFVKIAAGSADETRVWLRYCVDLNYVNEETWQRWRNEYEE
ncbi:four helix bundle protein, partial [Lonepinella sp. BR2271]|uniref:four helix bundle protein n=1 Tax=Lonepinella sp. BR2271 TaxID=3434550 RepID=UPI003F6E265B